MTIFIEIMRVARLVTIDMEIFVGAKIFKNLAYG